MQDLCLSGSTKPAKAQAPAWSVPRFFQAVCIAAQAEMQTQCWELLCSTREAEQRQSPASQGLPSKGPAEERPSHSKAQLPGLQATSELDHHSTGNEAQAEGLKCALTV